MLQQIWRKIKMEVALAYNEFVEAAAPDQTLNFSSRPFQAPEATANHRII